LSAAFTCTGEGRKEGREEGREGGEVKIDEPLFETHGLREDGDPAQGEGEEGREEKMEEGRRGSFSLGRE